MFRSTKICLAWLAIYTLITAFTIQSTQAFDFSRLSPIDGSSSSIKTGNKILYESVPISNNNKTIAHETDFGDDGTDYMDVNQIPVRFDETQLWRIYNISAHMRNAMPLTETLEQKFGGTIWKENSKFLDISFDKQNVKGARSFLAVHNISSEVLNGNIQQLIDAAELEGIEATQAEAGSRTKKATRSGMHWQDYHDLETIYAFMREIRSKFPKICRLYSIGKSAEGRDLKVLRISENPSQFKKVWIDGGIHAREWISPATVTFILYKLMLNWSEQPSNIREKTWYIMPVMNPDGYVYSRKVNRLWRKNRTPAKGSKCVGVDLNRNFDIGWRGYGSSTNPCSDTFRGAGAASEPETKAVAQFLTKRKHNLEAYLTFHSYGQMVVYPWAYKAVKIKDAADLQRVANTAVERIEKKTKTVYRAGVTHSLLGIAGGGSDDWCRAALNTKYVYTIELRDRGNHGFVLPPGQILDTSIEGYTIVETVAQAIK